MVSIRLRLILTDTDFKACCFGDQSFWHNARCQLTLYYNTIILYVSVCAYFMMDPGKYISAKNRNWILTKFWQVTTSFCLNYNWSQSQSVSRFHESVGFNKKNYFVFTMYAVYFSDITLEELNCTTTFVRKETLYWNSSRVFISCGRSGIHERHCDWFQFFVS